MTDSTHPFIQQYFGPLSGVLSWQDLDALWQRLRDDAAAGWYVYTVGEPVPEAPLEAAAFQARLDELGATLRREHEEDYCGIVYADDLQRPRLVKIYDPRNLGKVCGFSEEPVPPGWVLSQQPPVDVTDLQRPGQQAPKRRWWQWFRR